MSATRTYTSDVAFTPAVKAIQARKGSRHGYARMEQAVLAEEHQASNPAPAPDQSQHEPPTAQGPSPLPQERGGRQRGPVDLAYFEELSRLDEPASPADESNETPN